MFHALSNDSFRCNCTLSNVFESCPFDSQTMSNIEGHFRKKKKLFEKSNIKKCEQIKLTNVLKR